MKVLAVIHPDHVLDQARRGALSPEARRMLSAHIALCPVCAWEQSASEDFARERLAFEAEGEADAARLEAILEAALARAGIAGAPTARKAGGGAACVANAARLGRRLGAAAMIAAAVAALVLPSARAGKSSARDGTPLASTEAGLDAGALGAPSGGDS
jgi:hypothetical protein